MINKYHAPAFPCAAADQGFSPYPGITRLDYFVAAVLSGVLANVSSQPDESDFPGYAKFIVKLAKAIIDELDKEESQ